MTVKTVKPFGGALSIFALTLFLSPVAFVIAIAISIGGTDWFVPSVFVDSLRDISNTEWIACAMSVLSAVLLLIKISEEAKLAAATNLKVATAVEVLGDGIYQGITDQISLEGAQIHLRNDLEDASQLESVDVIFPAIRRVRIKAKVLDYDQNRLNLKFVETTDIERGFLTDWMKSQRETTL